MIRSELVQMLAADNPGLSAREVERIVDNGAPFVRCQVTDTGVGVAPDKQRELFQEYVQADASTASRSGGTGLGLVICRRLGTLMGGEVAMDSAPGRGTTLYLTVPLPIADPSEVEAGGLGGGEGRHGRHRERGRAQSLAGPAGVQASGTAYGHGRHSCRIRR